MEALKNHKFLTWEEVDPSQNILLTILYLFHFHSHPFVLHYAFRPNLSYCIVYTFYVNNFSCKYNLVTSSKSSEADSSQTRPVRVLFKNLECLRITSQTSLQNFSKIDRAGRFLLRTDGRTDGRTNGRTNIRNKISSLRNCLLLLFYM